MGKLLSSEKRRKGADMPRKKKKVRKVTRISKRNLKIRITEIDPRLSEEEVDRIAGRLSEHASQKKIAFMPVGGNAELLEVSRDDKDGSWIVETTSGKIMVSKDLVSCRQLEGGAWTKGVVQGRSGSGGHRGPLPSSSRKI